MAGDYRNFTLRLKNKGLDIVSPPDTQAEGKYSILTNVRNTQEELLQSRKGIEFSLDVPNGTDPLEPASPIRTIRRLNDDVLFTTKANGFAALNTDQVVVSQFGHGGPPVPTGVTLDGNPHSTVKVQSQEAGVSWLYVGNSEVPGNDGVILNSAVIPGAQRISMIKISSTATGGQAFMWGIVEPQNPAKATLLAVPGNLDSSVPGGTGYDWRYTYRASTTGSESNASPIVTPPLDVVDQQATMLLAASRDPQVDQIRLWRRGGTIPTWRLVATLSNTFQFHTDNVADSAIALAEVMPTGRDVPFTTTDANGGTRLLTAMPYIWGPFDGDIIFAAGDTNRPGYVYWTNPDDSNSADPDNNISVTDPTQPIIGGFIFGSNSYVWTRDSLWTLDFGGPTALPMFRPREIPLGMGLSAPWAFAIGFGQIAFLSKDGIYATDTNNITSLTRDSLRPIFLGESIGEFIAVDYSQQAELRLSFVGQELHFLYMDVEGARHHLVYDIVQQRWQRFESAITTFSTIYGDENQNAQEMVLGGADGALYEDGQEAVDIGEGDVEFAIAVRARTGAWDSSIPLTLKEFGNAILDADPAGNLITITPLYDANQVSGTPSTATGTGRVSYPFSLEESMFKSVSFDMQWTGASQLYQIVVLFREDEEPLYHWHADATSHEIPGWKHIRDSYWMIESIADITFTHLVDGVPHTYIIPSTNGVRELVHVNHDPTKGKLFEYFLICPETFLFYGEESYINIKPWNTALSYTPISPFISTGYAPYLRKEAGT